MWRKPFFWIFQKKMKLVIMVIIWCVYAFSGQTMVEHCKTVPTTFTFSFSKTMGRAFLAFNLFVCACFFILLSDASFCAVCVLFFIYHIEIHFCWFFTRFGPFHSQCGALWCTFCLYIVINIWLLDFGFSQKHRSILSRLDENSTVYGFPANLAERSSWAMCVSVSLCAC